MDPVTVLMAGLSAIGATIGETAIKDGYEALKTARKFGGSSPRLAERVDDYVQDPDTFAKPVEKALRESGAAQDKDVIDQVMQRSELRLKWSRRLANPRLAIATGRWDGRTGVSARACYPVLPDAREVVGASGCSRASWSSRDRKSASSGTPVWRGTC
jgi:hypothetical protein